MIKVSAFYPNEEGKKFDMGYYFDKHIPMIQQKFRGCVQACGCGTGTGRRRAWITSNLSRHVLSIFRFDRGISNCLRSTRPSDYGRYPQLHRHPAHDSDQ